MPPTHPAGTTTNAFKGLTTQVANLRLSRALRVVLHADERRISAEQRLERCDLARRQLFTWHNTVLLLAGIAVVAGYIVGLDAGGTAWLGDQSYLLISGIAMLAMCAANISIVACRAHRLRWEVHTKVVNSVLEFERASAVYNPRARKLVGGLRAGTEPDSAVAVTTDGIVVAFTGAWQALDFHDTSKVVYAVPVFRDGSWVRLPASMLVKGDLIALTDGETAPARVRCLDGATMGRRSSVVGLPTKEPPFRDDKQRSGKKVPLPARLRERDIDVLTLCGNMKRYELQETPVAVTLRKRLRVPHRPQPLFHDELRSVELLQRRGWLLGGLLAVAAIAVRSGITKAVPNVADAPSNVASVGLLAGLLHQLPALLLLMSAPLLPLILVAADVLSSAQMLALFESILVRQRWKDWRKSIMLEKVHIQQRKVQEAELRSALVRADVDAAARRATYKEQHEQSENVSVHTATTIADLHRGATSVSSGDPPSSTGFWSNLPHLFNRKRSDAAHDGLDEDQSVVDLSVSAPEGTVPSQHANFIRNEDGATENVVAADLGEGKPVEPASTAPGAKDDAFTSNAAMRVGNVWDAALAATRMIGSRSFLAGRRARMQPTALHQQEGDSPTANSMLGQPSARHFSDSNLLEEAGPSSVTRNSSSNLIHAVDGFSLTMTDRRRKLPKEIELQLAQERLLREAKRVCGDVAAIDSAGELVPTQYAGSILGDSGKSDDFANAGPSYTAMPVEVSVATGADTFPIMQIRRRTCCGRKLGSSPRFGRVFDGPSWKSLSGAKLAAPSWRRVYFYLRRMLLWHRTSIAPIPFDKASLSDARLNQASLDIAEAQRWANSRLQDDLIDVGFGMPPVDNVLSNSQLVYRLGAATVFCCADRNTVTEHNLAVENVMLLQGENSSAIIDLHTDETSPTGIRFDDKNWQRHINSLKPIGLACMLNSRQYPTEDHRSSASFAGYHASPRHTVSKSHGAAAAIKAMEAAESFNLNDVQPEPAVPETTVATLPPLTSGVTSDLVEPARASPSRSPPSTPKGSAVSSLRKLISTPRELLKRIGSERFESARASPTPAGLLQDTVASPSRAVVEDDQGVEDEAGDSDYGARASPRSEASSPSGPSSDSSIASSARFDYGVTPDATPATTPLGTPMRNTDVSQLASDVAGSVLTLEDSPIRHQTTLPAQRGGALGSRHSGETSLLKYAILRQRNTHAHMRMVDSPDSLTPVPSHSASILPLRAVHSASDLESLHVQSHDDTRSVASADLEKRELLCPETDDEHEHVHDGSEAVVATSADSLVTFDQPLCVDDIPVALPHEEDLRDELSSPMLADAADDLLPGHEDNVTGGLTLAHVAIDVDGTGLPHTKAMRRVNVEHLIREKLREITVDDGNSLHSLAMTVLDVPHRNYVQPLATEMGFTDHDVSYFAHVRHVYTVVGGVAHSKPLDAQTHRRGHGWGPGGRTQRRPRAHVVPRAVHYPWLKPALLASVVKDSRTQKLQALTQGDLKTLLANCSEYWDGASISPLTKTRRSAIMAMYQQWKSEDLYCLGVAYSPVSHQDSQVFRLLDETLAVKDPLGLPHRRERSSTSSKIAPVAPHKATLPAVEVGLGYDSTHVYLLAKAEELKITSPLEVKPVSADDPNPLHSARKHHVILDANTQLLRMQNGQIFAGMVAARYQPKPKTQKLIKRLNDSGIRFVYMATRSYKKTRPLAQKMGLETGWNCAISLMPRKAASQLAAEHLRSNPSAHSQDHHKTALGEYEIDDEDEDVDMQGVLSDEKRWRLLKNAVDEQLWDQKAQLPHGLLEIRKHLKEIDNVPLLVSLFTDSTPPSIAGMIRIMQENGEQVIVVCSTLRKSSQLLLTTADIGIAINPPSAPSLAPSTTKCVNAEVVVGGVGIAPAAGRPALSTQPRATVLPIQHPLIRLAGVLASLHAAVSFPEWFSLHHALKLVAESRRSISNIKQLIAFHLLSHIFLAMLILVNISTASPVWVQIHHCLWVAWILVPLIELPFLWTRPEPVLMSERRTPAKRATLIQPAWDILSPDIEDIPEQSPLSSDTLPAASGVASPVLQARRPSFTNLMNDFTAGDQEATVALEPVVYAEPEGDEGVPTSNVLHDEKQADAVNEDAGLHNTMPVEAHEVLSTGPLSGKSAASASATARFNPFTGGIHAESLIRYGSYADFSSTMAGHPVELSDKASRKILELLRATRSAEAADGSSVKAGNLTKALTAGIPPSQGQLDKPPSPTIPGEWRFLFFAVVAIVFPSAVVFEYLFQRLLSYQSGIEANRGQYPILQVAIPSSGAVQRAQAATLFFIVVWLCAQSAHFVHRSYQLWQLNPLANKVWVACVAAAVMLQLVESHIICAANGITPPLNDLPWDAWLVGFGWSIISFCLTAWVKARDSRYFEKHHQRLRAYFDTRLGMYSPR
jgi:hypothetical protein